MAHRPDIPEFPEGKLTTSLGPPGCGKTIIADLLLPWVNAMLVIFAFAFTINELLAWAERSVRYHAASR